MIPAESQDGTIEVDILSRPNAWPGYMDGAVRSGERASAEVLAAL